eukprot:TRINITY_DN10890_c0_g1_i1.p1 TRINITY_DN10890_c0_g1~~TRINITY_DN10890_c0_g1_i1.p1  ORF type:complete len:255 (-),score=56.88 TRINITY_DN10890_c0_g1_i1:143-907(-)
MQHIRSQLVNIGRGLGTTSTSRFLSTVGAREQLENNITNNLINDITPATTAHSRLNNSQVNTQDQAPSPSPSPYSASPYSSQHKALLDSIIRVNQAGEYGAARIYAGQIAALKGTETEAIIRKMAEQEEHHLNTFNKLIVEKRVRPTVLQPLWEVLGYALGYTTGMLGKEAAMACTVAVETVIGQHYNSQLKDLNDHSIDDPDLRQIIKSFRDDELEHLDIGLENDAAQATLYKPLTQAISAATTVAIELSKRY